MSDRWPPCPECNTGVFVNRESRSRTYMCHFCNEEFDATAQYRARRDRPGNEVRQ
jgi:hypothetical protein